jgi:steroid delta-isomerase-like uncharacterized protein
MANQHQYTTTVRKFADEVWNKGNYSYADTILSPSYVNHDPSRAEQPSGIEPFKQWATSYRTAIPDLHLEIEDIFADDDKVVWRWNAKGTHTGTLMNIAPTGKPVNFTGTIVSRFDKNGKWAEDWSHWNALGLFQQIGAVQPIR